MSLTKAIEPDLLTWLKTPQAMESLRREKARRHLLDFALFTYPKYEVNWHHRVLCEKLDLFAQKKIKRLMVFMPPRHGKSELVSRRLPAFLLGRYPDSQIISTSYSAELAESMNRDVQRIMDSEEYRVLFPNSLIPEKSGNRRLGFQRNNKFFEVINHKGRYRCAGAMGAIVGFGGDYIIIDDPVKNDEEAESPTYRAKMWEWYTQTLYSRLEKDGSILITLTRWHHEDLAGKIINMSEQNVGADKWDILSLPAIKDDDSNPADPRQIGEALWPNKKDLVALMAERAQNERSFTALYQQRPSPRAGNMFKRDWFKFVEALPRHVTPRYVRWWDKAGSQGKGSYTCGALLAYIPNEKRFYVVDIQRGQWSSFEREQNMLRTAALDKENYGHVSIWMEQEPGSGGKDSALASIHNLAGYPARAKTSSGDKEHRADAFAAHAQAGNVCLVRGIWNEAWLEEVTSFPYSRNSDQVDASASAFNELMLRKENRVVMYSGRV